MGTRKKRAQEYLVGHKKLIDFNLYLLFSVELQWLICLHLLSNSTKRRFYFPPLCQNTFLKRAVPILLPLNMFLVLNVSYASMAKRFCFYLLCMKHSSLICAQPYENTDYQQAQ